MAHMCINLEPHPGPQRIESSLVPRPCIPAFQCCTQKVAIRVMDSHNEVLLAALAMAIAKFEFTKEWELWKKVILPCTKQCLHE